MNWEKYKEKVNWDKAVYLYLTSPFGTDLYFWSDGDVTTMPYNTKPADMSDVVAVVRCPGIENIDLSYYEEGFKWDEKKQVWIDEYTGEEVGNSYEDIIDYLIKEVGLLDDEEFLKEEVRQQIEIPEQS